jgi:hypothetical protein
MVVMRITYLDLDQLLDAVNDENVFVARRRLSNDSLVTSPHVSILEGLFIGLLVVQVAENHRRRLDKQFARLVVASNLVALNRDQLALDARQK